MEYSLDLRNFCVLKKIVKSIKHQYYLETSMLFNTLIFSDNLILETEILLVILKKIYCEQATEGYEDLLQEPIKELECKKYSFSKNC